MSNIAKTHKSRKTGTPGKPRQRKSSAKAPAEAQGVSPVEGSSSLAPVTTASVTPDTDPAVKQMVGEVAKKIMAEEGMLPPAELPKEQQAWYRPPESKMRKTAEKISVMRAAGRDVHYIAKKLGITEGGVRFTEYVARKNGWRDENDEPVDIEAELANNIDRKIVRNISASLDGQMTNWQTHEMTVHAAKGRGMFKTHEKSDSTVQQLQVVAIRVEMPTMGVEQQVVNEENIGGVPAYLEGDVVQQALPAGDSHEHGQHGNEASEADPATI